MHASLSKLKINKTEEILINEQQNILDQKELDFINAFEKFESYLNIDKINNEIDNLKLKKEKLITKRNNLIASAIISVLVTLGSVFGVIFAAGTILVAVVAAISVISAPLASIYADNNAREIHRISKTIEKLSNISEDNKKDYYNLALLVMGNRNLSPVIQSKITKSIKYLKSNQGNDVYLSLLKDKLNALKKYYESKIVEDKIILLENHYSVLDKLS